MGVVENLFLLLGGIALFLFGLNALSSNVGSLAGDKMSKIVRGCTKNRVGAVLVGCLSTAVLQSSIATNMIAITLVQKGILSFFRASAIILGTNVGTTVTAQLVSLSTSSDFEITAIGSLVAFLGFLLSVTDKRKLKYLGGAMFGFGTLFIGLKLMTDSVECFKAYDWFTNLFLVKNPLLLLINGFLVTCVFQSSSVVTSILIVLASLDLMHFSNAVFIILGVNVGTCLPVILSSARLSTESKQSAIFNLAFNLFGTLIFFPLFLFFGDFFQTLFTQNVSSIGKSIANFHTAFNLVVCVIVLPMLKPFCLLVQKIYGFLYGEKTGNKRVSKIGNKSVNGGQLKSGRI